MSHIRPHMEIDLESWYVVDSLELDSTDLRVRMVPDYFNVEIANPVLEISIQNPIDGVAARNSIARLEDHFIVGVQLSTTAMELLGELDDTPTIVLGASVSHARSPYSSDDLLKIVSSLEAQMAHLQADNAKLRMTVHEVKSHAIELLRRAEAKKSLTTRGTATEDAQINVLRRILNKLGMP